MYLSMCVHVCMYLCMYVHVKRGQKGPACMYRTNLSCAWLAGWLAQGQGITTREPVTRLAGWLAAWGMAGWLRPRKAREAQRGPERRSVDRTSLSCAWLEAPHKQIYDQGGSPQISSCMYIWNPRGSPPECVCTYHYVYMYVCVHVCMYVCTYVTERVPNRNPLQTQDLPTSRITYDQRGSPQAM